MIEGYAFVAARRSGDIAHRQQVRFDRNRAGCRQAGLNGANTNRAAS